MPWRELKRLIEFAKKHEATPLVWVQIVATEGSTYRNVGAIKLVAANGESCGLISGGCLEKEIVEKALAVGRQEETHIFSTQGDTDRLFGYELGCSGQLTLRFRKSDTHEFLSFADAQKQHSEVSVRVIGAGADLDPLVELFQWTQWDLQYFTTATDLLKDRLDSGWSIQKLEKDRLLQSIQNPERTAVLLMSHNYSTDLQALSFLAESSVNYVGILGPKDRKNQLLEDLRKIYDCTWPSDRKHVLHGPIGLPGLGKGEDAVALSVVSQLQSLFYGASRL